MKRIRIIGLAVVAALALSAVAVASASAAEFTTFEATKYPVKIKAEQKEENVFQIGTEPTGKVTCKKAIFTTGGPEGGPNPTKAEEKITVHPEYSECTVFTVVGGTVTTKECNYEVFAKSANPAPPPGLFANVNVKCVLGKTIKVVAGACEVKVGTQNLNGLSYAPLPGPPTEVEIKSNVKKIVYTTNKGVGCPAEGLEATYTGSVVAKGFNPLEEKEQYGVSIK